MYFIIFIDDCSRYGYVNVFKKNSQYAGVIKIFLNKVKGQLNRKVKIVRLDKDNNTIKI